MASHEARTQQNIAKVAEGNDAQVLQYPGLRGNLLQELKGSDFDLKDYNAAKQKYGNSRPTASNRQALQSSFVAEKRKVLQALAKVFSKNALKP